MTPEYMYILKLAVQEALPDETAQRIVFDMRIGDYVVYFEHWWIQLDARRLYDDHELEAKQYRNIVRPIFGIVRTKPWVLNKLAEIERRHSVIAYQQFVDDLLKNKPVMDVNGNRVGEVTID